ncbi:hypothetical protein [Runella slithyformis]|uniref:Uncharacterized protein n=1 Tax=Runella slithyformis (strain ATCC 29530 / DSM 19594 / LMG 11500 / NCIMB 11436 / LSU 4) TaxID=761193 RepID=A0A7U4E8Q6_RUNSL|nr:hypothetical protein [Runella slithyformis]AEI51598.1 hypothetical protein Runsl_5301 [Runella slithyformis DSM 19594]
MTRCYQYGVLLKVEVSELFIEWHGKGQRGQLPLYSIKSIACAPGVILLYGNNVSVVISIPQDCASDEMAHELCDCISRIRSGISEDLMVN